MTRCFRVAAAFICGQRAHLPIFMEEGFLKVARRYFSHPFWREQREYSRAEAWLDLVQHCAYQPHETLVNGSLIEVPRGGIVASERFLSDRWTWSRTKVRAFLYLLEKKQMISIEKDHQKTVLNLCNYEKYNGEQTTERPKKDHRKTGKEPPTDQLWGTIGGKEEGKESKKLEANASSSSEADKPAAPNITELFHRLCPSLPKLRELSEDRKRAVRARWNASDGQGLAWFEELFRAAESSDFLSGRNGEWSGCSFDWLMNPKNARKVLEGNYHNERQLPASKGATSPAKPPSQRSYISTEL